MASKKPSGKNPPGKQRRPSARVAAAMRARQRRKRRRWIITASALALILAIVAVLLGPLGSSDDTASPTSTSTSAPDSSTTSTTAAPLPSAKGKPCVAVVDPLPSGAPEVPVPAGPPPASLVKKDLEVGKGAVVPADARLTIDYIGVTCSTGRIFYSSYVTGKSEEIGLDSVIAGWQQGIPGMKVGGTRLLGIPPALAYGGDGSPPLIAPDETLWFVVHVVAAK